jgi:hypothetical protein
VRGSKARVVEAGKFQKAASQNTSSDGLEKGARSPSQRAELGDRDRGAEMDAGIRHELEGRRCVHEISG